jgi:C1A family cysteine protease
MFRTLLLVASISLVLASKEDWNLYKNLWGKKYATVDEEAHRYECFLNVSQTITKLNSRNKESHGWNQFTDLCPHEFKSFHSARFTGFGPKVTKAIYNGEKAPLATVDWRSRGAVTPVKNQGMCGSCWTFSATGAMEGVHFLASGSLVGLSEEELVQCATSAGQGCQGGWMDKAIQWVVDNGGIDSEDDYGYTSGGGFTGSCDYSKVPNKVASFSQVVEIGHSEGAIQQYLASHGPVSIGVDASSGWQTYAGGIMQDCFGTEIDHGVLAVGYSTDAGTPYWIVKNSWGTGWGEMGYIRLALGSNQCGITSCPCSATA